MSTMIPQAAKQAPGLALRFWNALKPPLSYSAAIDLQGALGPGFARAVPDWKAATTRTVGWALGPAKPTLLKIADRFDQLATTQGLSEAQSNSLRFYSLATRQAVGMLEEAAELRKLMVNRTGALFRARMTQLGIGPYDDVWATIRDEIASGRPTHPMAVEVKQWLDQIDPVMQRLAPGWKPLPNYWPQYANAKKIQEVGELQYRALLEASLGKDNLKAMLRDPDIIKAFRETFQRDPTGKEDLIEWALASALRKPPPMRPDLIPAVRTPGQLFMHRRINLPSEARLHPYEEITTYMDDVLTWMADAQALGPRGERINSLIKVLQGRAIPDVMARQAGREVGEEVVALTPELEGLLANMGTAHRILHPGEWTKRTGDALEAILRYTMGVYDESEVAGGVRAMMSAMGTATMMVFSALPNLSQVYNDVIMKGFVSTLRGIIKYFVPGPDRERIRLLAAVLGQGNAFTRATDALYGVERVTEILGKEGIWGLIKNPDQLGPLSRRAAELVQRGYAERGLRGAARRVADLSLRLSGFSTVETWLRGISLASWVDELQRLQTVVKANPSDAQALRMLRRLGISGTKELEQFKRMNLTMDPPSWFDLLKMTPEKFAQVDDWSRLYLHALDQTQFNYMPLEFPILWSQPWVGSVLVQFRRFSYEQARKVVGMAVEEAAHGNVVPLLRMVAGAGTLGTGTSWIRDTLSGKDLYWLPKTQQEGPRFAKVKRPALERAAQARGPLGITMPEWAWERLTDAVSMGLMGLYTDALFTISEEKPMVMASWMVGIYPTEVFNLVRRTAQAGAEVLRLGERDPRKERFPKTREWFRSVIRTTLPVAPVRFLQPHLFRGPGGERRLREAGIRAFIENDFVTFNHVNNFFLEKREPNPITVREISDYVARVSLRRMGLTPTGPTLGEPGYVPRRRGKPAGPETIYDIQRRAEERIQRVLAGIEAFEEEGE